MVNEEYKSIKKRKNVPWWLLDTRDERYRTVVEKFSDFLDEDYQRE